MITGTDLTTVRGCWRSCKRASGGWTADAAGLEARATEVLRILCMEIRKCFVCPAFLSAFLPRVSPAQRWRTQSNRVRLRSQTGDSHPGASGWHRQRNRKSVYRLAGPPVPDRTRRAGGVQKRSRAVRVRTCGAGASSRNHRVEPANFQSQNPLTGGVGSVADCAAGGLGSWLKKQNCGIGKHSHFCWLGAVSAHLAAVVLLGIFVHST